MGNNVQKIPENYNLTHFQNLKLNEPVNAYYKNGEWVRGRLVSYLHNCKYENDNYNFYDVITIQTKNNIHGEIVKLEYPTMY